jgi:cytochrome b561
MIKSLFIKIKQNHFLAMVLCCAIPIIGILALSASGILGSWAYFLVFLLCPLGHIFMMRGMHSSHAEHPVQPEVNESSKQPEAPG